jgi:hypothetical protein
VAYGPVQSLLLLAVLAVSGRRLVGSAVIAALLMAVMPGYLSKIGISDFGQNRQLLAFGLAAVFASLFATYGGLMTAWFTGQRLKHADRLRHGPVRDRARACGAAVRGKRGHAVARAAGGAP